MLQMKPVTIDFNIEGSELIVLQKLQQQLREKKVRDRARPVELQR